MTLPSGGGRSVHILNVKSRLFVNFALKFKGMGRNGNLINRRSGLMYTASVVSVIGQRPKRSISETLPGSKKFWRTHEV